MLTPRLSVIIPAYNEERRLPRTFAQLLPYLAARDYATEVIVVDDGSTDGTAGVVAGQGGGAVPVRLLGHEDGRNHGKGAAVRRGMLAAAGAYRLFMDADNSTSIDHVESFWPWFDQGYDVVIGSRDIAGAEIAIRQSRLKELAGDLGNLFIRAMAVPGVYDTQAGFKMFTARAAADVFPRLTLGRWGFDVEALAIALRHGYRVKELPITWRNDPESKVRAGAYLEVLKEVLQVRRNLRAGVYDQEGR